MPARLPDFPHFKRLEIEDQEVIEHFVRQYPPYSDFNFVSMLAFNIEEMFQLAILNDNLVIKFRDYITGTLQPFYSFLGNRRVATTIAQLLDCALTDGLPPALKLVPEANLASIFDEVRQAFTITEDDDNFDYIIPISHLHGTGAGRNGRKKRKLIEQFRQNYPNHVVLSLDLNQPVIQTQVRNLCAQWATTRALSKNHSYIELTAIERVLRFASRLNLVTLGVYLNDRLVGFTINEAVHDGYYMGHFGKTDRAYAGLSVYLESVTASMMAKRGCTQINLEQDCGLQGLRSYKQSWHPTGYLKKYLITPKG